MKKPLKYSLFLFTLGVIVATLLAFVNSITAPIIAEAALRDVIEQLEVVDSVNDWSDETLTFKNMDSKIVAVYIARNSQGEVATVAYNTVTTGYSNGEINVLTFIDAASSTIKEVKVVSTVSQTEGIGRKVEEASYASIFKGKSVSDYANKTINSFKSSSADVITGATMSSRGVISGIILATSHFSLGEVK